MTCSNPVFIPLPFDKNGKRTLQHNPVTGQIEYGLKVPCGKCTSCKIAKAREWALRLMLEMPYWQNTIFVTLTYNDESLTDLSLDKRTLQLFFKRLRKLTNRELKYFACGEYGDKSGRKHFHAIIFGIGLSDEWNYDIGCYYSENHFIERCWNYGNVFNGDVTFQSCRYVAEYVFKKYNGKTKEKIYVENGLECPFQLQSRGLGLRYVQDNSYDLLNRGCVYFGGRKLSLPRYFVSKLEDVNKEKLKSVKDLNFTKNFYDWKSKFMPDDDLLVAYYAYVYAETESEFQTAQHNDYKKNFFNRSR